MPSTHQVPQGTRMPRQQRREQLLQVAREVFSETGYHQTTMDDIAEAANVSKPVLYQHFSGKVELYESVLGAATERFEAAFSAPLDEEMDNQTRTQQVIGNFLSIVLEDPQTYQMLFESGSLNFPMINQRVQRLVEETGERLALTIREETGMSAPDTSFLARTLLELAIASSRIISRTDSVEQQQRQQELLFKLVWRGMDMVDTEWS